VAGDFLTQVFGTPAQKAKAQKGFDDLRDATRSAAVAVVTEIQALERRVTDPIFQPFRDIGEDLRRRGGAADKAAREIVEALGDLFDALFG